MKSYKLDRMLYVTSMAQYLGAADLTRLNFHFFVVAIVHIQQTKDGRHNVFHSLLILCLQVASKLP